MCGSAADARPILEKKKRTSYVALIKDAVEQLCEPTHVQLRDWPLDLDLLLNAQDMLLLGAWPRGDKVLIWPDPNDEPTPTHAGNYIQSTRSGWLSRHLHEVLHHFKEQVGIHPTRPLEAVSHLVLREKVFKFSVKKQTLSHQASSDPA